MVSNIIPIAVRDSLHDAESDLFASVLSHHQPRPAVTAGSNAALKPVLMRARQLTLSLAQNNFTEANFGI